MSKVTVVSENGKLVGTWIPPQQAPAPGAPVAKLVPRPGQQLHEIEVENPEQYHTRAKSEDLVKLVKSQLKLT